MCLNVVTKGGAALLAIGLLAGAGCSSDVDIQEGRVEDISTNPCRIEVSGENSAEWSTASSGTETWEAAAEVCRRVEVGDWIEDEGDGGIDLQLGGSHDD